ncbi:RNA polymerase, Rpb [Parasponia andersonii]|uniref:RNA polymerase, Rpb n=1 Tax=Parasponia andersonii TaxID=3476 RepID=A0A2P5CW47_PARAD|nr:RNA polymerase, Rpb [Parasponia andersonii]
MPNHLLSPCSVLHFKVEQKSLLDKFKYIMHGLVYNLAEDGSRSKFIVGIYAPLGGLQILLKGDPSCCTKFKRDQKLFLLVRKVPHNFVTE